MNHQNMHRLLNNCSSIQNSNYAKEISFKSEHPPFKKSSKCESMMSIDMNSGEPKLQPYILSDKSQ